MKELQNWDYIKTLISLKERRLQTQYNSYISINPGVILAYPDIGKTKEEAWR